MKRNQVTFSEGERERERQSEGRILFSAYGKKMDNSESDLKNSDTIVQAEVEICYSAKQNEAF